MMDLHQQIQYGEVNYENGFFEASISVLQHAFNQLASYRLSLENDLTHFQALHQSIVDRLILIRDQCAANQVVQAINLDGEMMDEYLDVDYWNDNNRQVLIQEIEKAIRNLDAPGNWCNSNLLENYEQELIPGYLDRYANNIQEARRKALNAQLRFNTAQLVMVSLVQQGYRPEFGEFSEDDQRNGYLAIARGPDGSEITIKVDPSVDFTSNLEVIARHGKLISEAEMKRKTIEIMQSLKPYGLQVGEINEVIPTSRKQTTNKVVKKAQYHPLGH